MGDLRFEGEEDRDVAAGDGGVGGGVRAGGAARRCGEPAMQHVEVGAAGVAHRAQPGAQPFGREPVRLFLAAEAVQEPQGDVGVHLGEKACGGGEHDLQVGAELVGHCDPVGDQVPAGADRAAQGGGRGGVAFQRPQPTPVGADDVGQDVGVESVVLVSGRSVPRPQVLHLHGRDDQDDLSGLQQRVDDGAVGTFDADLVDTGAQQLMHHVL